MTIEKTTRAIEILYVNLIGIFDGLKCVAARRPDGVNEAKACDPQ